MDGRKENGVSTGYLDFKCLPDGAVGRDGNPAMNKYSSTLTRGMADHCWASKGLQLQNTIIQGQRPCSLPPAFPTTMPWKARRIWELRRCGGRETRASKPSYASCEKLLKISSMHRTLEALDG